MFFKRFRVNSFGGVTSEYIQILEKNKTDVYQEITSYA